MCGGGVSALWPKSFASSSKAKGAEHGLHSKVISPWFRRLELVKTVKGVSHLNDLYSWQSCSLICYPLCVYEYYIYYNVCVVVLLLKI